MFRVISVAPPVRFAVVQDTDPLQVDAPEAIVQPEAERVPEGAAAHELVVNETSAPYCVPP